MNKTRQSDDVPLPSWLQWRPVRRIARFEYGEALPSDSRQDQECVHVFGSNGPVGTHGLSNTMGPVIVVGRKGSFGKINYSTEPVFAIDTAYFIDGRKTQVNLRWLYYVLGWLRLDSFSKDSAVPGLSREDAYSRFVPWCEPNQQRMIADFLDRETARIDELIAMKERLIDLLDQEQFGLMSTVCSRGLNPVAEMVRTGFGWLLERPKRWSLKRLRHISPRQSVGLVINPSTYVDPTGEVPFFFGSDVKPFEIRVEESTRRITHESNRLLYQSRLNEGDIVVVRVGYPGVASVVPKQLDQSNCASMMIVRRHRSFNSHWLCYCFNSHIGTSQVALVEYGAAQRQFNISHAVNFWFPVPPIDEQDKIVEYLERNRSRIQRAQATVSSALDKLREYRTALISAAVTGQIDVRTYREEPEAVLETIA
jgi:type I restriction enzyme S subunit